jgi:anti-sigma factor RsiW
VDRMTPPEEHHRYREQIGAFLLGELDGGELEAMQAHLNSCPVCQAEVRELEPVVAALADADPDRIDEDPWPPGDLEELTLAPILGEIHRARRRRRRFGWSALAAAAICVVVIGLAGSTWFLEPAVALEPLSFSVAPGMKVEGHLIAHAWGTEIRLVASGLRDGQTYKVTLVSEDGERVNSGTFIGAGDKLVRGTFTAALLRKDAARLEVRTPGGELVFLAKLPEEPRVAGRDSPLFGILPRGILPWAGPDHQNETPGASRPESKEGPSAKDTAPATTPADTQEKPKAVGSGGGTPHQGSSPESDVKGSSPGGEPSASAAASPTASASAAAWGTTVVPAAPPSKDQAPAESQYGGGN